MATHRQSEEEKILNYFQSAPLAKVEIMFNLIRPIARKRVAESKPLKATTALTSTTSTMTSGNRGGRKTHSRPSSSSSSLSSSSTSPSSSSGDSEASPAVAAIYASPGRSTRSAGNVRNADWPHGGAGRITGCGARCMRTRKVEARSEG